MLIKIKTGTNLIVNGEKYTVRDTSITQVSTDGGGVASLVATDDMGEELSIHFDKWAVAISENDLLGLTRLLTTG